MSPHSPVRKPSALSSPLCVTTHLCLYPVTFVLTSLCHHTALSVPCHLCPHLSVSPHSPVCTPSPSSLTCLQLPVSPHSSVPRHRPLSPALTSPCHHTARKLSLYPSSPSLPLSLALTFKIKGAGKSQSEATGSKGRRRCKHVFHRSMGIILTRNHATGDVGHVSRDVPASRSCVYEFVGHR